MKHLLTYFDCGHAAFQQPDGAITVYQMPGALPLEKVAEYIPAHLKGSVQLIAQDAKHCGACNKFNVKTLLDTLADALEDEGLSLTPAELVSECRRQMARTGYTQELIQKLLPPGFVYTKINRKSSSS